MAHLHDRHALPVPVEHLVAELFEHFDRQRGGAGAEIEHAGHDGAEVAVEHVAVVGVNHARTRRASARQVVRRRRQPAQQARLRHVRMNDGRLPGAELSIQPPQRAQIVERRQRAAQRRQEHRVGAGRQQVAHVAFAVTETAVEESRAVAVRVECGGESGRLDRRSADVEARDHAGDRRPALGAIRFGYHEWGRPLSFPIPHLDSNLSL